MLRFLHTADWQIGRQYARFHPDDAALLAEARFETVAQLATIATEQRLDFVVVAGDVFDSQTLSDRQILRCFKAMQGFAGPWLLLPGNHDAALSESVWTRAQRLQAVPDNVYLLLTPEALYIEQLNTVFLPGVLTQRQSYQDLSAWFDTVAHVNGQYRIGVAHGSVQGILADNIDSNNPIAADRAQSAQLDYLALGDWHGTRQINNRTWYSGTPEPDRFKDNQSGQALIVEIAQPGSLPVVTPVPTAGYRWTSLTFDFHADEQLADLAQLLQAHDMHSVLELDLTGHISLQASAELTQLLGRIAAQVRTLDVNQDHLQLSATDEDISNMQVDGYVHAALQALQEQQSRGGEQGVIANDALLLMAQLLKQTQAE